MHVQQNIKYRFEYLTGIREDIAVVSPDLFLNDYSSVILYPINFNLLYNRFIPLCVPS